MAHVTLSKYADHLPLYRQLQQFEPLVEIMACALNSPPILALRAGEGRALIHQHEHCRLFSRLHHFLRLPLLRLRLFAFCRHFRHGFEEA